MSDKDEVKKDEVAVEETKTEDTKPKEWDKERQRADQAEADLRKEVARSTSQSVEMQSLTGTVKGLQEQLEQIEAAKNLDLKTADPDSADIPDVVKTQEKIIKALEDATKEITALKQKATLFEKDAQLSADEKAQEKVIERISKPLDTKYGAKFRNEARARAEKEVSDRGRAPADSLECHQMLEKHYIDLVEEEKSGKKKTTVTDGGKGGNVRTIGEGITEGSLDDVVAQVKKKGGLSFLLGKTDT